MTQAEEFLKMLPCETINFRNTNLYAEYRRAKCDAKKLLARFGAPLRLTCTKLTVNNSLYDVEEICAD
jgi:hypothetical protein